MVHSLAGVWFIQTHWCCRSRTAAGQLHLGRVKFNGRHLLKSGDVISRSIMITNFTGTCHRHFHNRQIRDIQVKMLHDHITIVENSVYIWSRQRSRGLGSDKLRRKWPNWICMSMLQITENICWRRIVFNLFFLGRWQCPRPHPNILKNS